MTKLSLIALLLPLGIKLLAAFGVFALLVFASLFGEFINWLAEKDHE